MKRKFLLISKELATNLKIIIIKIIKIKIEIDWLNHVTLLLWRWCCVSVKCVCIVVVMSFVDFYHHHHHCHHILLWECLCKYLQFFFTLYTHKKKYFDTWMMKTEMGKTECVCVDFLWMCVCVFLLLLKIIFVLQLNDLSVPTWSKTTSERKKNKQIDDEWIKSEIKKKSRITTRE